MGAEESGDDGSCMSLLQHARHTFGFWFSPSLLVPRLVAYDVMSFCVSACSCTASMVVFMMELERV